ncbi:MAG: hypothetical protein ACM3N9_08485 [Syntrophothermus sp.]
MNQLTVMGLLITDRIKEAGITQGVISRYAHIIKSRLGFHEVNDNICSRTGFILLQIENHSEEVMKLEKELEEIGGLEIQKMKFNL